MQCGLQRNRRLLTQTVRRRCVQERLRPVALESHARSWSFVVLAAILTVVSGSDQVHVCSLVSVVDDMVQRVGGNGAKAAVMDGLAVAMAVQDVTSENCSLLGDSTCSSLLLAGTGGFHSPPAARDSIRPGQHSFTSRELGNCKTGAGGWFDQRHKILVLPKTPAFRFFVPVPKSGANYTRAATYQLIVARMLLLPGICIWLTALLPAPTISREHLTGAERMGHFDRRARRHRKSPAQVQRGRRASRDSRPWRAFLDEQNPSRRSARYRPPW